MNNKLTILYTRLSREDGEDGLSNSISNQIALLTDYAERNGFVPYRTIQDDGFSGGNFNRPGWQKMIALVDSGEVSTIICKDSSRMARNYLQAGLYRERFRECGVRLICVNDGTDTFERDDEFTPFREIMAEWYIRDCSHKIRSALQTKARSGKPIANIPPYDYVRDLNDKNHWIIEPQSAEVVRRIYQLTIDGKGPQQIAHILHDDKVERPSYYHAKIGKKTSSAALDTDTPYTWHGSAVSRLIAKPEYAGHTVNFRTTKPSYKAKHSQINAPENWLIFPNTHEAIVPQVTWDLAQELRKTVRRVDTHGEANPLTGLLWCHECGSKMYNNRSCSKDYYYCSGNQRSRNEFAPVCSSHTVMTDAMRKILLEVIRKTAYYVRDYEDEFAEKLRENNAIQQGETVKSHARQIVKNEKRIAELDKLFTNLYEDKVSGAISTERFAQMSENFEREQAELREKNAALQSELDTWNADGERADRFIELVQKYTRFEELTTPMINAFVERIEVHDGVWSEKNETDSRRGQRSQQIDVYLKYIGKFEVPETRTPEEIEEERIAEETEERRRKQKRESQRRSRERKLAAATA